MTKMAIYDKNQRASDEEKTSFFQFDYAYKNNFWTRLSVTIGFLILILFYIAHKVYIENTDVFSMDFKAEGIKIGMAYLYVIIVYTVISSVISNIEYLSAERRMKRYFKLVDEVNGVMPEQHGAKAIKRDNIDSDNAIDDMDDDMDDDYERKKATSTFKRTRGEEYAVRSTRYAHKPVQKR